MNKVAAVEGASLINLLSAKCISNRILIATVAQIAIFEVFKNLGLECEFSAPYLDGKIPYAYAKQKIGLDQALLLAVHLDILEKDDIFGDLAKLQKTISLSNSINNKILKHELESLLSTVFTKVN